MTPEDLRAWRAAMGFRSQAQAAEALGYSVARYKDFERGKSANGEKVIETLPRTLALACSALYHRLEPWSGGG